VRAVSCPATVPLPCPTYVVVVPVVFLLSVASACSTIRVPLSHYSAVRLFAVRCSRSCSLSAVLGPVRVFAVRCSHALIRHGCCMRRYSWLASHGRPRPRLKPVPTFKANLMPRKRGQGLEELPIQDHNHKTTHHVLLVLECPAQEELVD
jgi:hypothetical protein